MLLTDILQPDCLIVPLEADDKQDAIFQLADLLCEKADIPEPDKLKEAIWKRETVRTTGIGGGVAVPHGKTEKVPGLKMAIGRTAEPLEFGAIDRNPVELIILLASPVDQTGPHIEALSRISRLLIDPDVRDVMKSLPTPEALYAKIKELETAVA